MTNPATNSAENRRVSISIDDIMRTITQMLNYDGWKKTKSCFDSMEQILSGQEEWPLIKRAVTEVFAEWRKLEKEEDRDFELERIRAGAPNFNMNHTNFSSDDMKIGQLNNNESGANANYYPPIHTNL